VVLSDEDDDGDDTSDSDVLIIDDAAAGESASAAGRGSQARKGNHSSSNVINIDDDEDEEDGTRGDKAGPSMSRASGSPAAMTPGRGSPRNRYGIGMNGMDSMSDSSESDLTEGWDSYTDDGSSDCEILDDTYTDDGSSDCEILDDTGTARKMWETAASRKKPANGVHECKDAGTTAFESRAGLETQPGKNSEHLFGAECHPDESMSRFCSAASKYDSQNSSSGTKECPGRAQSSAGNANGSNGPSVPNAEDVPNDTSRSKDGHDQSSVPNVEKCSMVGSEKASEGVQSPRLDENSACNFASANRFFSGISSTSRKDGSPPISVSTPEKVDEKIPDQSPPEASFNTNIYSAQDNGPVRGKDLLQDPEDLGLFASLIGEREKHKESVEYKRAAEEEWASRQRQLQIQAEEAKKLRKRKKAEAQRLLDMEKRQKQRLQEVRESQRKNEEAIQLKEQYRGVVRKELEDLERRHWDMTSILHALGISVEGGEVKAFKQALLKFHPDRVSRNDIYQQVKAEETFKFISRLKEKLPRLS